MASVDFYSNSPEKREFCGVIGVYSKTGKDVATALYQGMLALQHRGQDAAGLAIWNNKFVEKKGLGLVSDVFCEQDLRIKGRVGIGHTRYPTTGTCMMSDVQPFISNNIAISHNGQVSNYKELRGSIEKKGVKFISSVDSEVAAAIISEELAKGSRFEKSVSAFMNAADGAYTIAGILEGALFAFKDPNGIRPMVWGESEDFIIFASETVALDVNDAVRRGDIKGGELAIVKNGKVEITPLVKEKPAICMFEYVYFSRPDSVINNKEVFKIRENLGVELAREHPAQADIVIEVPDSARNAAHAYAKTLGIPHAEGLIKNRYIGRTFIMPSQQKRKNAVKMKLNVIKSVVAGKRVALIDDSIVRGTTLKEIVGMLKHAGATEVHVRITCPPIIAPCFYGIDMSTYEELVAHEKSVPEIGKYLGADSLGYLSIGGLKKVIGLPVCTGCLNKDYPTDCAKKLAGEQGKW